MVKNIDSANILETIKKTLGFLSNAETELSEVLNTPKESMQSPVILPYDSERYRMTVASDIVGRELDDDELWGIHDAWHEDNTADKMHTLLAKGLTEEEVDILVESGVSTKPEFDVDEYMRIYEIDDQYRDYILYFVKNCMSVFIHKNIGVLNKNIVNDFVVTYEMLGHEVLQHIYMYLRSIYNNTNPYRKKNVGDRVVANYKYRSGRRAVLLETLRPGDRIYVKETNFDNVVQSYEAIGIYGDKIVLKGFKGTELIVGVDEVVNIKKKVALGESIGEKNYDQDVVKNLWPNGFDQHIHQGHIRDCYFWSALGAMHQLEEFGSMVQERITLYHNGRAVDVGEETIVVTRNELGLRVGGNFGKEVALSANIGDLLLNFAYQKKRSLESGGDYINKYVAEGEEDKKLMLAIESGYISEILTAFGLDYDVQSFDNNEFFLLLPDRSLIERMLKRDFDKEKLLLSCKKKYKDTVDKIVFTNLSDTVVLLKSKKKDPKSDNSIYNAINSDGEEVELVIRHSYYLSEINPDEGTCLVSNSHDSKNNLIRFTIAELPLFFVEIVHGYTKPLPSKI